MKYFALVLVGFASVVAGAQVRIVRDRGQVGSYTWNNSYPQLTQISDETVKNKINARLVAVSQAAKCDLNEGFLEDLEGLKVSTHAVGRLQSLTEHYASINWTYDSECMVTVDSSVRAGFGPFAAIPPSPQIFDLKTGEEVRLESDFGLPTDFDDPQSLQKERVFASKLKPYFLAKPEVIRKLSSTRDEESIADCFGANPLTSGKIEFFGFSFDGLTKDKKISFTYAGAAKRCSMRVSFTVAEIDGLIDSTSLLRTWLN